MSRPTSTGSLGLDQDQLDLRDSVRTLLTRHVTETVVRDAVEAKQEEPAGVLGRARRAGPARPPPARGGGRHRRHARSSTAVVLEEPRARDGAGPYLPTVLASAILDRAGHTGERARPRGRYDDRRRRPRARHPAGYADLRRGLDLSGSRSGPGRAGRRPVRPAGDRRRRGALGPGPPRRRRDRPRAQPRPHPPTRRCAPARASARATYSTSTRGCRSTWPRRSSRRRPPVSPTGPPGPPPSTPGSGASSAGRSASSRASSTAPPGAWPSPSRPGSVPGTPARAQHPGVDAAEASLAAATAGAVSVEAAFRAAKDCINTLGGIGFTWEHDASLYLRRAQTLRAAARPDQPLAAPDRRADHRRGPARAWSGAASGGGAGPGRGARRAGAGPWPRGRRAAAPPRRARLHLAAPPAALGPRGRRGRPARHRRGARATPTSTRTTWSSATGWCRP